MAREALTLAVYLNQTQVGTLTRLPQRGDLNVFVFDDHYLDDPQRPTLSLGFKNKTGGIAYTPRVYNTGAHPFFTNLLPEGKLREYIAARNGVSVVRDFPLLLTLGEDLPGAVSITPVEFERRSPDRSDPSLDDGRNGVSSEDQPLKFSLAGVQLKFSAIRNNSEKLTIPAYGRGGSWIVKLPSDQFEAVPENEFVMMRVAARAGLAVPPVDLVAESSVEGLPQGMKKSGYAFAIRRFDRGGPKGGERIHIEDFAQVFRLPPSRKYGKISYGNIAEVIWSEIGPQGLREFIEKLIFNIAIGNGDMHLKNWSLIYPDRRTPQLAPAYDYLSTLTYVSTPETMALSLAGTRSFQEVSVGLLARFAQKHELPSDLVLTAALEAGERAMDAWSDLRGEMGIPRYMIDAVENHMQSVPLLQTILSPAHGPGIGSAPRR